MMLQIRWLCVDLAHAAARLVAALGLLTLAGKLQDWAIGVTWDLLSQEDSEEDA
ncbi:MAG: hypothetical protein ACUVX9_15015 [Anaerolineae bacterium]